MECKVLYRDLPVDPAPVQTLIQQGLLYELVAVAIKIKLFETLHEAKSADALAKEKRWNRATVQAVLEVLVETGFLTQKGNVYQVSPMTAAYLTRDHLLFLGHSFLPDLPPNSFGQRIISALEAETQTARQEPEWTPERLRQIGVMALANRHIKECVSTVDLEK